MKIVDYITSDGEKIATAKENIMRAGKTISSTVDYAPTAKENMMTDANIITSADD